MDKKVFFEFIAIQLTGFVFWLTSNKEDISLILDFSYKSIALISSALGLILILRKFKVKKKKGEF